MGESSDARGSFYGRGATELVFRKGVEDGLKAGFVIAAASLTQDSAMRASPLIALSVFALTACEPIASPIAWDGHASARQSTCDGSLGPADVLDAHQALQAPNSSGFEPIGDTPILDGTSAVIGGLYSVQFFELDASGTYQPTSFFQGPSGYAFGQSMSMDDGLTLVGEDNFQLPGQSNLTGRVRAYRRDATGHWALDPVTPYLNAADMGLQTASGHLQFGDVLEQEGNTLVVGASRADNAGNTSKGVFTFTEDGGWQLHTILPNVGNGPAAIRGDYIVTADRLSGTLRVFKRTGGVWSDTPVATIAKPASGSSQYAQCSDCMAWDGDRIIVGDIYANNQNGGAVVFERDAGAESFSLLQTVTPPGSGLNGFSLEASQDRLYVGSGSGNRMTVYTFDSGLGQYVQSASLTGSAGYGRGVSVDGNRLLVGQSGGIGGSTPSSDRAILYTGLQGVFGFCADSQSWIAETECIDPLGPTDDAVLEQGLTSAASTFAFVGDMPVIDGTSVVMGGLTDVQFYEADASGLFQPSTFVEGPNGFAFGRTLAMSDGRALIGEDNYQLPGQTQLTGRVRAYQRDDAGQWSLDPTVSYLNASDMGLVTGSTNIGFGNVIKMDGPTAVVGVQRADGVGSAPKGIYTYTEAAGWELDTVLSDAGTGPAALSGDYIAAASNSTGTVRVYKRSGGVWDAAPVAVIPKPASGSSQYARCTNCMAWDGDRLLLGDIYADGQRGGVYVFERQIGGEAFSESQLLAPGGPTNGLNGFSIAASDDRLYMGSNSGTVTVYEYQSSTGQYVVADTLSDDSATGFGRGLSVDGNRLLVGRGRAAREQQSTTVDRGQLFVGSSGRFAYCPDAPAPPGCLVGESFDWDGDGEDDGCRGVSDDIDPSVVIPAGTQVGEGVQILPGVVLGDGNVLADNVFVAPGAVIGDDNELASGTVVGRRAQIGSGNVFAEDTVIARSVIIGDDNHIEGSVGYGSEIGSNVDLPDVTIGSLVTIGSASTVEGQIVCPGPLVVARGAVIAPDPTDTFSCTGPVIIGPDVLVESAQMGGMIRIRKQASLMATVTLGDDVRIGRSVTLEGGVELLDGTDVDATVRLCDDSGLSGRFPRAYVDPTCL